MVSTCKGGIRLTPRSICFQLRSIATEASDSSVFVNAADDRIDSVGDEEDDECGLDGDLLQKSFHDTHAERLKRSTSL